MQGLLSGQLSCAPMTSKQIFSTANRFEQLFGYKRAVRKGPFIFVSGTTSLSPQSGTIQYPGDPYKQTIAAFAEAIRAIEALGGKKEDVCRVRMFVRVRSA